MNYSLLGKRIREERLRLNLTQERLAEDINISTAYLGQIERGERHITLDKLIPLAERLGVSVDFLLSDYVHPTDDASLALIHQLFDNRTDKEKMLAINMIKLIFSSIDEGLQ
ncbi:MAG: helix-turn-helix domain-containing protein [Bacteroidales bacterium]|nr:helix-turn-helix domain-containing protein [Bacteroidales bacterium]MCM1416449.1 helix-turn-helix domain-containing protein [bacterium]MCM1424424.1 helix-turn-helix domain-containing protein [bacterium]